MADGANDVTIKVGAKADEAGVKAAADKVTRSLDLVLRKAQAVGTDAAKALTKQIEAIKSGVAGGSIGAKEAETLANQFIRITKNANGTSDVIGQYNGAIRIAAANSQRFTSVLDDLAAAERRAAEAQAEAAKEATKVDFMSASAAMRQRLGGMGTAGAKSGIQKLAALEAGVKSGSIGQDDLSGLAKTLAALAQGGEGATNTIKKLDGALAATAATSQGASEALEKVGAVYTDIRPRGGDGLDKLREKLNIDQQAQEFADAIAKMAKEAEDALPESQGFIDELKEIQKILSSGGAIDGKALADMAKHFAAATKEAQGLDSVTSRRLLPNLLRAGEAMRNIKPKGDIAGAAEEVASAIGNIDPVAQGVSRSILDWAKNIRGVGSLINKFPGTFALVGVAVAAVVAGIRKMADYLRQAIAIEREVTVSSVNSSFKLSNQKFDNQILGLERQLELQRAQLENSHAIAEAERQIAAAGRERNKALEMAGALSEDERRSIERRYAAEEREAEYRAKLAGIAKDEKSNAQERETNSEKIATLERQNEAVGRLIQRAQGNEWQKLWEEGSEAQSFKDIPERLATKIQELVGKKDTEGADEARKQLEQMLEREGEAIKGRIREIETLKNRNAALETAAGSYESQREAAKADRDAAVALEKSAEEIRKREISMQNQDRRWTLEDRDWEEERAEREKRWSQEEQIGGSAVSRKHANERLEIANRELEEDSEALRKAQDAEVARINAMRSPGEQIYSIGEASENELSEQFRRERARYEGFILRDKGNVRSAEQAKFQADMQGNEREAELYGQMRGSKNRLTAMGLGGDVGAGQQTARNTRLAADRLSMLVPLVKTLVNNRKGRTLDARGARATWGME